MAQAVAALEGDAVWIVGGAVRDALLGSTQPPVDLDLVVEGDARAVGVALALALGVRPSIHDRFQTVALIAGPRAVDVVTARRETYPQPGALPEVTPSSLADDLARRDFTVNAMAVCVRGPERGRLADPHGGRDDLAARRIRRIRPGEFSEDPSRTVRGARYAARLGFTLDDATHAEMRDGARAVALGSARVAEEVRRMAVEGGAAEGFRLLAGLGVPWARADVTAEALRSLDAARCRPGAPEVDPGAIRLGAGISADALPAAALPGWARSQALSVHQGDPLAVRLRGLRPSEVDRVAGRAAWAAQVAAVAAGSTEIAAWWRDGRDLALEISGADLLSAGLPAGPGLGRALAVARAAALDGEAPDREAQLRIALEAG